MAMYFDRPLLPTPSRPARRVDAGSQRSLTDWVTFYQAGVRFVEYLKHTGTTGPMISVWHEGGAIYPSPCLQSTSRRNTTAAVFATPGPGFAQGTSWELLALRLFDPARG